MEPESPEPSARPARSRRGYWIPGAIAMTVLLVMALALGAGDLDHQSPKSLDGQEVAGQVSLWLQATENLTAAPDVRCPPAEPIRIGLSFVCHEIGGHGEATVDAVETSAQGQLTLSLHH